MKYPRTLIVTEKPFSLCNGFGVTLTTFFGGWPKDHIMLLHRLPSGTADKSICRRTAYAPIPGHRGRRYAVPYFLGMGAAWRGTFSGKWLRRQMGNWRPETVYSFAHSRVTLAYGDWAAREQGCPHIAHMADDPAPRDRESIGPLFRAAAERIVISAEMKEVYEKRYGAEFKVLYNGADERIFLSGPEKKKKEGPLIIRYVGALVRRHHAQAMEDVTEAVKEFNDRGGNVRFEIYGGEDTEDAAYALANGRDVLYRGSISRAEGFGLLRTADLLVVPVSFSKARYEGIRLSMPTKLAEYLASGTPTLVYGPPGSSPVEFCERNGLGIVRTQRSVQGIVEILKEASGKTETFRARARRDREFIRKNLSADAVRMRFKKIMVEAVRFSGNNTREHETR